MQLHYQKEDVLPYMLGLWRDALKSICGLRDEVFSGKHRECPNCGGKDRFRWTDKLDRKGDGGYICNGCGNDTGLGLLMRLTGEPFSECVDILGRYLGKVPQEVRVKANKAASRDSGYSFGKQVDHEACVSVMERTSTVSTCQLGRLEAFQPIGDETYSVGVRDGREVIAAPCYMVHADGLDDEMCNVLFVPLDQQASFLAKDYTRGSVCRSGSTEKVIYLCLNWIEAQHVRMITGQETWSCFTASNLEIVAHRYKGDRQMRVICQRGDTDTLIAAEERGLLVNLYEYQRGKLIVYAEKHNPSTLLN